MLVIPLVNAGWGDDGWGECGWGEDCVIEEEGATTDLTSPSGSQTGDRTPEQIALDTVPDGKEDCEEKGFIFYQGACYECSSKSGRLVDNQETGEILCQTCGTGYIMTSDGICTIDFTTELLISKIKETPILAALIAVVFVGISVGIYKENKKIKEKVKKYLKIEKGEGMGKKIREHLKKEKEKEE